MFRWFKQFSQSPNGLYWDDEVIPGTGAPADTGATPAAATPAATPSQPAIPAATPAPATSGAPGDGWVPSYRVRETREAAMREAQQQFAQREAAYQAELQRIQHQLHSLVGVTPPQDPNVSAVKDQFAKLYPGLSKMEERAAQLEQLLERAGDLESQTTHYWQSYGKQTMDRLFTHATESLGAPLTEEGKRQLHASFVGFVQSSPEMTERYANDPSIVEDFWKAFTSSFIDPVRRGSTAAVAGRAAAVTGLPQDRSSGVPPVASPQKPANLDERAANAWALYQSTAKT
jgi:hypothetical protein